MTDLFAAFDLDTRTWTQEHRWVPLDMQGGKGTQQTSFQSKPCGVVGWATSRITLEY